MELNNKDKHQYTDRIISLIHAGYTNLDFSIQGVAEQLGITIASLSQYFKDNTGITITQYITDLKFNKAKQLLSENDKPLKDIISEIGYYDVSSFIRKFKKHFGITPNEYRKQCGKLENDEP
jgi:AraC-like DNA-binding protein